MRRTLGFARAADTLSIAVITKIARPCRVVGFMESDARTSCGGGKQQCIGYSTERGDGRNDRSIDSCKPFAGSGVLNLKGTSENSSKRQLWRDYQFFKR